MEEKREYTYTYYFISNEGVPHLMRSDVKCATPSKEMILTFTSEDPPVCLKETGIMVSEDDPRVTDEMRKAFSPEVIKNAKEYQRMVKHG